MKKMVKVDLITGFLGAGKTTFIHGYVHYLNSRGIKIQIIENEFGSEAVDTEFLKEDMGDACTVSDLTGMCMCCVGKQEFVYLLKEAARNDVDRIIVEPSGIYDVDEFFDIMNMEEISDVCEIGCIITIADAQGNLMMTEAARYLMSVQIISSGTILLSKIKGNEKEAAVKGSEEIREILSEFGWTDEIPAPVYACHWNKLTCEDYEIFMDSGYNRILHERMLFDHGSVFSAITVTGCSGSLVDIRGKIRRLFRFASAGKVFRVKGIIKSTDGNNYKVNCTEGIISIEDSVQPESNLVIIGQRLNQKAIESILFT